MLSSQYYIYNINLDKFMKRECHTDNSLSWVDYVDLGYDDDYPEGFLELVINVIGKEPLQFEEDIAAVINFVESTSTWEHIMLVRTKVVRGDVVLNFFKSFNILELKE